MRINNYRFIYTLQILSISLLFLYSLQAFAVEKHTIGWYLAKCEEARSLSQYDKMADYSATLITLAKDEGNKHAETYARFYNGLARMFRGESDSQKILDEAHELAIANGNDSVVALVLNAKGIFYAMAKNDGFIAQQYFFKSLDMAKNSGYEDLQYRVRGNLLTLSHNITDSLAYDNARQVYDYGVKTKNNEHASLGAYYLATYYCKQDDYNETEKYLRIALDIYKDYPYADIPAVYALYAKMLINKGDYEQARQYAEKGIQLSKKNNQPSMEVETLISLAEVLNAQADYKGSIDKVNMALEKAVEIGLTSKIVDCNQLLANNYAALGNYLQAMKYLQLANSNLRDMAEINMERLSYEQQVMNEFEKKESDAKLRMEQIASQRLFLVMLGIVVAILLTLLIYIYMTYRRRNRLYKTIVQQNTKALLKQKELQEQIEQLRNSVQKAEGKKLDLDKDKTALVNQKIDNLYEHLCQVMEKEHLYAEAQMTREKLAERLGTNRTYLTAVIKEKTGMNYLQFINSYRINEALQILSDKDKAQYPLKQIWSDLGFSSATTFFKLFQQTVGITPSIYRKQVLAVNEEGENAAEDEE